MDRQWRDLLDAAVGEPPHQVDMAAVRRRVARRRVVEYITATAAVAVVAVVAVAAIPFSMGRQAPPTRGLTSVPAVGSRALVHRFNPLVPYAGFGWLPAGRHITSVMTASAAETVEVGGEGAKNFVGLDVYLPGRCNHSSGQILALLRRHRHPQLACTLHWGGQGGNPTLANTVATVAPRVDGHPAFWVKPVCNTNQCDPGAFSPGGSILVWSYAPDGWATLEDRNRTQAVAIAGKIRYGAGASSPIKFPAQLTSVPAYWQVPVVQAAPTAGVLAAQQWAAGDATSAPSLIIGPSGHSATGCALQPASAVRHQVINGYHVATTTTAQGSQICATNADGLRVYVFTGAGVTPDAIAIFAHHLRLLGPNPARWTTRPIG